MTARDAEPTGSSSAGPSAPLVLAVAAVSGAAVMVIELAAVRLLAPWFGASSAVWTNVIGVVLLALSVGYLAGARLSRTPRPVRALCGLLLCGGAWTILLPACAAPVAQWLLGGGELALERSPALFAWGSLAAAAALFGPAAGLLGGVGPLAVELLQRAGVAHAGTAGGRVLCVSTLGSLAGTFATTHLALPSWGLGLSFRITGLVLVGLAGLLLIRERRPLAVVGSLALGALAAVTARGPRLPLPQDGARVLAQLESAYQSLRVVESADGTERLLQVNEGLDSFQSVWRAEEGLLPLGFYYDYFAPPLAFRARERGQDAPLEAWVVGFGAGTVWRVLSPLFAESTPLRMTGIEVDGEVVRLGREWMSLPSAGAAMPLGELRVLSDRDGRAALRDAPSDLDAILLDAYANQSEIPAHLSSVEFMREARSHLAPGGWFAANVGGFGVEDPVVEALASTVATAFEQRVLAIALPFSRNVAVWAVEGGEPPEPGSESWNLPAPIGPQLLPAISLPGLWRWIEPRAAAPLTDDRNPIDALQRRSLERGARLLAEGA